MENEDLQGQIKTHEITPGGGEGFVTSDLPSAIYIHSLHPNTNANFDKFTKKLIFEGTIHKLGFESSIYTSRNTLGRFPDI